MVRESLGEKFPDEDIELFIVYIPMLGSDNREAAVRSLKDWEDPRYKIYWDGEREIGKAFAKKVDLASRGTVAWDIYFLFGREARWKDGAPKPDYWMHQLGGVDPERRLDGKKLHDELDKILKRGRIQFLTREGCPNTPLMRSNLDAALKLVAWDGYTTVDLASLSEDDLRLGYGTPTVLVDGVDIMGVPMPKSAGSPG